jgi:hypothetical protein
MLTLTKRAGQHEGSIDGIAVTVREQTDAAQRANGTWFLTICSTESKLAQILKCQAQFFTLTEARAFANAVIERAGANPTRLQVLAAVDAVLAGPDAIVDLDAGLTVTAEPATAGPIVVVPCGASKLTTTAPAAQMYTSQHFRLTLKAAQKLAEDQAGRVFILSALHGLIPLDRVLAPYDVKMGDRGCITPAELRDQLAAIAPTTVTALLPKAYRRALELAGADVVDLYANAPGIGYQRGVASQILASRQHAVAVDPTGHVYAETLF